MVSLPDQRTVRGRAADILRPDDRRAVLLHRRGERLGRPPDARRAGEDAWRGLHAHDGGAPDRRRRSLGAAGATRGGRPPAPRLPARGGVRCSIALFAVLLGGCATEIVPPPAPETPVRVGVLDHGRHARLVVELLADRVVRYAYGDWDWYALGRSGPAQAVAALFWPTRGALGRRRLPGPAEPESIGAQVPEIVED